MKGIYAYWQCLPFHDNFLRILVFGALKCSQNILHLKTLLRKSDNLSLLFPYSNI